MPEGTQLHIGAKEQEYEKQMVIEEEPSGLYASLNNWVIMHQGVNVKEKVVFYRLLATMVNAGIGLVKTLHILEEQTEHQKLKRVIRIIVRSIESGDSFSSSLMRFPDVFTEQEIGMIRSGEVSGKLSDILLELATAIEKRASIRSKIRNAMLYPAFIILVMIAATVTVMTLVIPKLAELFASAKVELPTLTKWLIVISDFFVSSTAGIPNWIFIILAIVAVVIFIQLLKKTHAGKYAWDSMLLRIPIFGKLFKKVALANFCRSLSALITSGVSIVKSLQIVADSIGNEVYKQRVDLIVDDVKKGITIADNLQGERRLFPVMVVSMIGIGEKTAQLDMVTGKIAEFYEEEVNNLVANLSKLMEPLIIVVIGIGVGLLVGAVMIPVMRIAEVASQG